MKTIIDIGANLSNQQFHHDFDKIILKSIEKNIKIILTTTDAKTFFSNLSIFQKFNKDTYLTYGLHPHNANDLTRFLKETETHYTNNKHNICSIGEYGLDYNRMFSEKEEQINCMSYFLEFAKTEKKPSFLHERDAVEDFINLLKPYANNKNVVHCFTGNKNTLKKYLDLNCYIGITGWICDNRRNQDLIDAIKYLPIEKIMVETDAPYLKPRNCPIKHHRNEPHLITFIIDKLASLKNVHKEDLIAILNNTTTQFFNL